MSLTHTTKVYALILAGGEGTRFFPLSTPEKPKQFLNFVGEGTFIQQTWKRLSRFIPDNRILVATNSRYVPLVKEQLPRIDDENILVEPFKRNTAPCIAYAAKYLQQRDSSAIMLVCPSDHVIGDEKAFLATAMRGVEAAATRQLLVTMGIRADWPASCYGYIRMRTSRAPGGALRMSDAFVEKPDRKTAECYLEEGNYVWNSGIFIWSIETILNEIRIHLPEMHAALTRFLPGAAFRDEFFRGAQSISIDCGVMEYSQRIGVIPCEMQWNDVGTWESLREMSKKGNVFIPEDVLDVARRELGEAFVVEN